MDNNKKFDDIPYERKKKIIKEELQLFEASILEDFGSTSEIEMEELLRQHFRKIGGIPDNITNLSVLFPALDKAGLEDVTKAYRSLIKLRGKKHAMKVLEPVRKVLQKIMDDPEGLE